MQTTQRRSDDVRFSTQIRPISYLKANAAKSVTQDVATCEQTQETPALLKILALGNQQISQGRVKRRLISPSDSARSR